MVADGWADTNVFFEIYVPVGDKGRCGYAEHPNYEILMRNEAIRSMGQTNIGNKSYAPKHCMWYLHTGLSPLVSCNLSNQDLSTRCIANEIPLCIFELVQAEKAAAQGMLVKFSSFLNA